MQISIVMLLFSNENFREGQKFSGGETASGGRTPAPSPPVEESQTGMLGLITFDFFTLAQIWGVHSNPKFGVNETSCQLLIFETCLTQHRSKSF